MDRIREALPELLPNLVPIVRWLPSYPRDWLRPDLIAGLTSWAVMVPVALAYAGLAGVPAELGLTTAFAALAAYAIFGTSRHLKVTTSSTMAIMSASLVADLAAGRPGSYIGLTAALALVVGVILLAGGLLRLGFISDFLTKSVVTGFVFGLAITIVVGQLPKLFGVPGGSGSAPAQLIHLVEQLPETNLYALALGVASLAIIFGLRLVSRRIPGALVALVLGIVASQAFELGSRGVGLVGEIQTGRPTLGVPNVPFAAIPFLLVGAAGIVFLAVGESVGAARAYAAKHHYEIDASQELVALGASNLATGLFGGFTVDASLSQTATGEAAGAKSEVSSLFTSALVLGTAIFLAPLFRNLPNAVLGAIVIAAVVALMDVDEMRRYWTWRRTDFAIALVALLGVVFTTVLAGLVIAVLLSVTLLLYRASRPHIAAEGLLRGHRTTYGDLERHPDAEPIPGLVLLRLDAPLYFFNANVARSQILDLVARRDPPAGGVLIDIAATSDLDVTTADMLFELLDDLGARSVEVLFAQVKRPVRDRMRRTGLMDRVGEGRVYLSVSAAVDDFRRRHPAAPGADQGSARVTGAAGEPPSDSPGGDTTAHNPEP